ncbi:DUF397 domain-containing protein [Streptomyces sp. NPDC102437]|uniref:DUF397 domain-containing protein n=1 Tax=Streptomyces sp. NPDC102437 TaxID=3366175 RepID=UPI0037FB4C42
MHSTEPAIVDGEALSGWRKSSYSGGSNGECLEVADGYSDIPVRDSKTPGGPTLVFSADGWSSFVAAVKGGHTSI